MKVKIYANYGILGKEKKIVYGVCHSEIYDEVEIEIPDGFELYQNSWEAECIKVPCGDSYMLSELLAEKNNAPCFKWYDKNGANTKILKYNLI